MSMFENHPQEPSPKRRKIEQETNSSSLSSSSTNCKHFFIRYGLCCTCRKMVESHQTRAFSYLMDGLQLSHKCVAFTKHLTKQSTCLNDKKLHLVLDLDHTLRHTVMVSDLAEEEKYLTKEANSREDLWRFNRGYSSEFLIKLRPFVHEFFKEANEMYLMYVYTMGDREYAKTVLKLIDPEKKYFGRRVITRKDSPCVKTLDLVLVDECGVVIVDDSPQVWPHHKSNLLEITKYNYFRVEGAEFSKSYAVEKRDESHEEGSLANVLRVLKEVYEGFFEGVEKEFDIDSMDVRLFLHDICKQQCF